MHGSDVLFNGTRRSGKCHTGTEGFQTHAGKMELVFAAFGCNFSLAFQRAKERRNPSSYADRKSTRLNSSHVVESRMPSSA